MMKRSIDLEKVQQPGRQVKQQLIHNQIKRMIK